MVREGAANAAASAAAAAAAATSAAAASLQAVLQSRRDREVVEKFSAKELVDHQREQLREDQKNLDEMALRRRPVDFTALGTSQNL